MNMKQLLIGFAVALFITGAQASGAQLYSDSTLVVRDRFSDEITGRGPDLVFIPGLASSRQTWKATADRLKTHYRVHLIQVAGFAGEASRANATGPVLVPTAEALDAYLVEQHLTPAVLIGHSLGGTITLYLAQNHPAHFKKVMLVDALPFYSVLMMGPQATVEAVTPIANAIRNSKEPMSEAQRSAMLARMATSDADKATIGQWGKDSDGRVVKDAMVDDMLLDLRPGLPQLTVPTTQVHPDYNQPGSEALYQMAFAPAKNVKLVTITSALHFVMFDQPAQFDAALDAFLKE